MPDQRRKKKSIKPSVLASRFAKQLIIFLTLLFFVFYIYATTNYWDGHTKLVIAINQNDQGITVATFDPNLDEITKILIPPNTQIELSRQLGEWKLGSVWQLGIDEGLQGLLLTESITRHFKFPVYVWSDIQGLAFTGNNPLRLFSATFKPFATNLGFGDKIRLAFFTLGVKNAKRITVELKNSSYLQEEILVDGEMGHVIAGKLPQDLAVIFADIETSTNINVVIYDSTGKVGLAQSVGELIETIGVKVASVSKKESADYDCLVGGKNDQMVDKISRVLNCDKTNTPFDGAFDIKLSLGEKFARRF